FVQNFLLGCRLDVANENSVSEGETTKIFVSQLKMFNDGMDELLKGIVKEYTLRLDVTFKGELAQDMRCPRKEKLFTQIEGESWSMLQGGLLPSFMHDSLINKMFGPLAPEEFKTWKNNFMMVSADLALSRNILQNHELHNINAR
ncbi:uncharacterized protein LOC124441603, partial [Xenia sp. Carnegie-2017]|uniref:uncharacterized protein LOC124441603 n=1 Tax=Xenia sp. Carnegie-2017 TaxID=2897299 RepID=UPI001F035F7E